MKPSQNLVHVYVLGMRFCKKVHLNTRNKPKHTCTPCKVEGAQCLSGRVLDSRPRGRGFELHRRHCLVFLSNNINPCLELVQPRKTRAFMTDSLLMGRKESNHIKQNNVKFYYFGTLTGCLLCRESHPLCRLNNPTVIKIWLLIGFHPAGSI